MVEIIGGCCNIVWQAVVIKCRPGMAVENGEFKIGLHQHPQPILGLACQPGRNMRLPLYEGASIDC